MRSKLRTMRLFIGLGGLLLIAVPSAASAHDNLGGDELAVANWMLIGALVTIVLGVLWGVWAWRGGQFTNVEESKYTMIENSEDYDAIMAEADALESAARTGTERAPRAADLAPVQPSPDARPAVAERTARA